MCRAAAVECSSKRVGSVLEMETRQVNDAEHLSAPAPPLWTVAASQQGTSSTHVLNIMADFKGLYFF